MRWKLSLDKHVGFAGFTECSKITICLRYICSHDDLIEVMKHESIHAVMYKLKLTTNSKQDHKIMQYMETEWF